MFVVKNTGKNEFFYRNLPIKKPIFTHGRFRIHTLSAQLRSWVRNIWRSRFRSNHHRAARPILLEAKILERTIFCHRNGLILNAAFFIL